MHMVMVAMMDYVMMYDGDGGAHVGDGHTCSSCLVDGCLMMPLEL